MVRREWQRPELWGFSDNDVKTMQKLRGPRLVSAYGTGQCVLVSVDDGDEDGGGSDGDVQPPNLRPMHRSDTDVWDFIVCEPV